MTGLSSWSYINELEHVELKEMMFYHVYKWTTKKGTLDEQNKKIQANMIKKLLK